MNMILKILLLVLLIPSLGFAQDKMARMNVAIMGGVTAAGGLAQVGGVTSVATAGSYVETLATPSRTLGSGTNRLLVACISFYSGGESTITSVTYDADSGAGNDKAFTQLIRKVSGGYGIVVELWYAVAAESGGTGHFDVIFQASTNNAGHVVVTEWSGVNQTTPMEGAASGGPVESDAVTINISSETGAQVIDCTASYIDDPGTAGAGQSDLYSTVDGQTKCGGGVSIENGAATVTMSWAKTGGHRWITCGASINPN